MIFDTTGKWPVSEKILTEIGRIAIAFSQLEGRLIDLTAQLIDPTKEASWKEIEPMDFSRMIERMRELVTTKLKTGGPRGTIPPDLAAKILTERGAIKGKLTEAGRRRSEIFHARWQAAMTIDPNTNRPHVVAIAAYASQHSRRTGAALWPWWIPDLAATATYMNDTREALEPSLD